MKLSLLTPLLIFVLLISLQSQGQNYSRKYMLSDGLPSQEIYDLHQDKNGLIWIACDRGIASFNGIEFKTYDLIDGLPNNVVFEFFEQKDGTIWCTTKKNELFYFHPDTLVFHSYKYNDKLRAFYDNKGKCEQRALILSEKGDLKFRMLWKPGVISISSSGEFSYSDENWDGSGGYYAIKRDKSGYPFNRFKHKNEITTDLGTGVRHHLWEVGDHLVRLTEYGYQILKSNTLEIVQHKYMDRDPTILNSGTCEVGFWIGYSHAGIQVLDKYGEIKSHLAKEFSCTSFLKDRDGGTWVGTHGSGLLYYSNNKIDVVQSSLHKQIRALYVNDKNQLVFLTNERLTFNIDKKLNLISTENRSWDNKLGQYYYSNNRFYPHSPIEESGDGIIVRYSDNRNRPPLFIYQHTIFNENGETIISVGTHENNIKDAEYLGDSILFANSRKLYLINESGKKIKVKDLEVEINDVDICNGKIYCATKGKGVIVLSKNFKILNKFNTSSGAVSNYVIEVLCDGNEIWMASSKGLTKVYYDKNEQWKVENLTTTGGLSDPEVSDIEIFNNRLFVATREGVCYFKKSDWNEIINGQINVHIKMKKLLVNGLLRQNLMHLSHLENQIEIDFELIAFSNSKKLNIRYKLLGFDSEWNYTTERKILYHSLPPGEYEVVIQPVIGGIPRNELIREQIEIHPAFYNEWWFRLSLSGGIVLIIWLFFKYRILNYNRDVIREILRHIMRRLRPKTNTFVIRSNGKNIKVRSEDVLYVESSRNYITIKTTNNKLVIREKISNFISLVPDPLEYVRIKRSIIVRVDKVTSKSVDSITIGSEEIKVGNTYQDEFRMIEL